MVAHFDPPWVSVIDESIQECINLCRFSGWMFVPHKSHPFGNKYYKISCDKSKFIYNVEILERKYRPRVMGLRRMGAPFWGVMGYFKKNSLTEWPT